MEEEVVLGRIECRVKRGYIETKVNEVHGANHGGRGESAGRVGRLFLAVVKC